MNKKRCGSYFLIHFLLIIIFLYGSGYTQKTEKTPGNIEELKQEIKNIIHTYNIPGVTLALVSSQDIIWAGAIGNSNNATHKKATNHTIFRWGSVSKSFISIAMLMLAERGVISLDDKIGDIVPEISFQNRWETEHPVRIVHCLEHTTGFDDMHFKELATDDSSITLFDGLSINPNPRSSRWQPGIFMAYNNVAPSIAAYIVEKMTGQSFEEFVQENIFVPLGMNTASFYYPEQKDLMSKGYGEDGITEKRYDHIFIRPSGSLNASAQDMAYFVQMLLNRGMFQDKKILSPESIIRMEIPQSTLAEKADSLLGYGLGNYATIKNGIVFHGHAGGITGFGASYGYNVDLDLGYAVAINSTSDGIEKIVEVITSYFTSALEMTELPVIEIPEEDLLPFTGYYQGMPLGNQLQYVLILFLNVKQIALENGKLFHKNYFGKNKMELAACSENIFHRKGQSDFRVYLFKDKEDYIMTYSDIMRGSYIKTSTFRALFQLILTIFLLGIMLTSPFVALIWIPIRIFRKNNKAKYLRAQIFSLLGVLFFFTFYILLLQASFTMEMDKELMIELGTLTIKSFLIFFCSICFAICTLLGLFFSIRSFSIKMNYLSRIHSLLVSLANSVVMIYFLYNGIIGIMTWIY